MKLIVWIIRLVVFLFLLSLALANTAEVTLNLFLGHIWTAPLIMIGLAFFVVGGVIGVLATLPSLMRIRLELRRARRELARAQNDPNAVDQPPMLPPV
ncbi:membrane protein [Pandoraea terrae]|uniref:Membrane protein n=1 Tax=Pandoraea terrae TaxID=1537710 RepID=A0A5E4RHC8_9BURK|nr:lipopolysaccharide assembly protein LapA domain-containing protein [Pandoraea terrae]VVD62746.1 membrane protein [Pandoraea terrae]